MQLTPEQEAIIKRAGKDVEQFKREVAETPSPLSTVKQDVTLLNEKADGFQNIDMFTLEKTVTLEEKTQGMQNIDDFTLSMVMQMQARIDELEARVQTLEGAK